MPVVCTLYCVILYMAGTDNLYTTDITSTPVIPASFASSLCSQKKLERLGTRLQLAYIYMSHPLYPYNLNILVGYVGELLRVKVQHVQYTHTTKSTKCKVVIWFGLLTNASMYIEIPFKQLLFQCAET